MLLFRCHNGVCVHCIVKGFFGSDSLWIFYNNLTRQVSIYCCADTFVVYHERCINIVVNIYFPLKNMVLKFQFLFFSCTIPIFLAFFNGGDDVGEVGTCFLTIAYPYDLIVLADSLKYLFWVLTSLCQEVLVIMC